MYICIIRDMYCTSTKVFHSELCPHMGVNGILYRPWYIKNISLSYVLLYPLNRFTKSNSIELNMHQASNLGMGTDNQAVYCDRHFLLLGGSLLTGQLSVQNYVQLKDKNKVVYVSGGLKSVYRYINAILWVYMYIKCTHIYNTYIIHLYACTWARTICPNKIICTG